MIYLIAAPAINLCKIGTTGNVASRLSTLQTASPFDLTLIATREGDHALEGQIHARVREHHVKREWFQFIPAVVTAFHETVLELRRTEGLSLKLLNETASILNALGGAAVVARELGVPYTTVASWREKNHIPHWRHNVLLKMAAGKLLKSDFPPKSARVRQSSVAA